MALSFAPTDWTNLVARIQAGDEAAAATLYSKLRKGARYKIWQQLGSGTDKGMGVDDCLHDVFLNVLTAIRSGQLRDPERLMGFVRTVRVRQTAQAIEQRVNDRRRFGLLSEATQVVDGREDAEAAYEREEKRTVVRQALAQLSARERHILISFYIEERPWQDIAAEMGMTHTQFRLSKSRAKEKLGKIGQAALASKRANLVAIDSLPKRKPATKQPEKRAA